MCLAELFFVEKFSNWPDRPLVRSLQDNAGEKVCVLVDKPGVYVSSIGEDRDPSNRITLEGTYGG